MPECSPNELLNFWTLWTKPLLWRFPLTGMSFPPPPPYKIWLESFSLESFPVRLAQVHPRGSHSAYAISIRACVILYWGSLGPLSSPPWTKNPERVGLVLTDVWVPALTCTGPGAQEASENRY